MKEIIHFVNVSNKPLFKSSAKLMTEIFTVSRLDYKPDLVKLKSICPLPIIPSQFNLDFDTVATTRAETLWANSVSPEVINVLWSGGIDSTCALVALIITRPHSGKINVYCNLHSIIENRELYKLMLSYSFIEFKNSSAISDDLCPELITGELGDQIFGSDFIFAISNLLGFKEIFSPFEKVIPQLFKARCGENDGKFLYEKYYPIVHEAPFKIVTAFDFVWWWNFSQKWQCIKFHQKSLLDPRVELAHFYEDENFQSWSFFNHHLKIGSTLNTYKMPAKDFIFKFDKNSNYHQNKTKYASPLGNNRYFYTLFEDRTTVQTYAECVELIDALSPDVSY